MAATPYPQPGTRQCSSADWANSAAVVAANSSSGGRPQLRQRPSWPTQSPRLLAGRPQPPTTQAGLPNTGSAASKASTSARNSGRTTAISFSSRPAGTRYAADSAGVQVNRHPASGRGLGGLAESQRLPPLPEQPAPARGGCEDLAGQGPAGRGDGPRDHRKTRMRGQDGGQLGGGLLLPAGPVGLRDPAAGHHDTPFPVSQPAFSSAARASSAVRCP